MMSGTLLI